MPPASARIIIVEDEAIVAMDLRERLTALGYEVCGIVAQGEAVAQKVIALRPDVLLMDINLAGAIDGVKAAQLVGETCDVPIVFLTAYSDSELVERASRTNAYGFLVKPFDERELHATLQVALVRHAAERDLHKQVNVDPLTGMHNRRFLDEMLPLEISRAHREGHVLTLVMIDIDEFKQLNDTHGHDAGDYALKRIGSMLRGALRASDFACRYGGEEFTVVMPNTDASGAAQKMSSICAEIRQSELKYQGRRLTLTVSAGVAELSASVGTAADLLRAADDALYRAKREGRDRVCEAESDPWCS